MSVKLGIAPIAWSNDDMPELGGDTSLETCLSEAREAGFTGIESGGKFPKTSRELLPILNKHNINLCSGWYGANLLKRTVKDEMENIRTQLDLFKDCNAPCIVFAEVTNSIQADESKPLSKRPKLDKDDWKNFCEKINEVGKRLEGENMPLAYHHHMGTVIQSHEDTERLMNETNDTVKLTIDTGHMLFAGGNSLKIIKDFKEKIAHVHCKDMREKVLNKSLSQDLSFRHAFLEGAFTVPGDGCIDYRPIFNELAKNNYQGWLVVEAEQDPKKANPFEYAKIGFNYLKKTSSECGLEIIT
jgi:inosose dehydratase